MDIGKTHRYAVVINAEGERLLSRGIENGETELLALIGHVLAISDDALWAVDLYGGAALLIGLDTAHDQPVAYLTGLAIHRRSALLLPTKAELRERTQASCPRPRPSTDQRSMGNDP
ncbi:transposase [Streptomyces sp. NPDC086783]|uniref:IS110 family transposase n=1 Tax=Streptomyces sp. NPDC086783 TaxID=3365758 RepID=UPI0038058A7E